MRTATIPTSLCNIAGTALPIPEETARPVAAAGRGPMRSVFWRIFLWFWLAMLLLATAVAATVCLIDPDQFFPQWRVVPLKRMEQLAAGSIAVFEEKGGAALREYLAHLPPPQNPPHTALPNQPDHAFLFDANTGHELSGQPFPADAGELVARSREGTDPQFKRLFTQAFMSRSFGGKEGRAYVFVLATRRISPWLPITPQAWMEFAAALATSALVCYGLTRNVVAPVRRLQAATRRLASGDLGTRVATTAAFVHRRDEFSELAGDFDVMAARIENLLTAQRQLIADISHELGSPLTRVNVALGLAFRKAGDEVRPELERIEREAQRVNELIRQLLLLCELENRAPGDPAELIDLPALVREVAADAEFEAGSRHCRVRIQTADGNGGHSVLHVTGVRHLLHSAVENVVRNAVRYTAEDSEVSIEIESRTATGDMQPKQQAVVRVRDHGPGVPPSALAHLFRPFYRVSEARDRQSGGTGLGLAITRQAVEAHGGSVRAMNHPDGGLLVEVELTQGVG